MIRNLPALFTLSLFCFLFSCSSPQPKQPRAGVWRASLEMEAGELPFGLEIDPSGDQLKAYLINAEERILIDDIKREGDTLVIPMHIFNNDIRAYLSGDSLLTGTFNKYLPEKTVSLPFKAEAGKKYRFNPTSYAAEVNLSGKWATTFYKSNGDSSLAIGLFDQKDQYIKGTFLTSTGDYRYLEGQVSGNTLFLSAFDGDHAFLFQASLLADSVLRGEFWSGKTGYRRWEARRNELATLPLADTLTRIASADSSFQISFPEYRGGNLEYPSASYQNKVVIVQILGTWCPNCMDETIFLRDWLKERNYQDVEVIGLAFEYDKDFSKASERVKRMAERLQIPYAIAIAGVPDSTASAKLPMISKIKAYPTSIILDKKGKIRYLHTGFIGPGTGKYFEEWKESFDNKIAALLKE
jgi:thiol-disulfide isomerase/thioredoxin